MGCWNGTCAITNVPVMHNDEVVVLLLTNQYGLDDNKCYPNSYWQPYSLYFEGKYNDYGAVEDCHGPMLEYIMDDVKHHLYEIEQGENEYHDIAVKQDGFNIDKFFEADHERRLFIKSGWKSRFIKSDKQQLTHIIILKDVFDGLINQFFIEQYLRDPGGDYTKATYKNQYIGNLEASAQAYVDTQIYNTDSNIRSIPDYEDLFYRFCLDSSGHAKPDMTRPIHTIKNFIEAGSHQMARTAAIQLARISWIDTYMNSARRMWCPQSGAGSQDSETLSQRLTAKLTVEAADKLQARFDE